MDDRGFIQVILPLRIEWEPYYCLEDAVVGERVEVAFAHRTYVGVVSRVGVSPGEELSGKIQPAVRTGLPLIGKEEIAFWRLLADYYLCTPGEVFKAAYPSVLRQGKPRKLPELSGAAPSVPALPPHLSAALEEIQEGFARKKTVLLQGPDGSGKTALYLELARRTLAQGRSVLYLVPEIALSRQLEERVRACFPDVLVYDSARTSGSRRAIATVVRQQDTVLVLGARSALFLPHHNLGLVIVDAEHDSSYKQDAPAPRYNAREASILLAGIHGASVVLGSETPSLESLYNADKKIFHKVEINKDFMPSHQAEIRVVDTQAELRKKGMTGHFSLKLLEEVHRTLDAGGKVLLVCRAKSALQEYADEMGRLFPAAAAAIRCISPAGIKHVSGGEYALSAVLQADNLLGKEDFRADEKTLRLLARLRDLTGRLLLIQTREPAHPVFQTLLSGGDATVFLEERRVAAYPPFTRLIQVELHDANPRRLAYMASLLQQELAAVLPTVIGPYQPDTQDGDTLRCLRILLPRDKQLKARKQALLAAVTGFEKGHKYSGHIVIDVDPV